VDLNPDDIVGYRFKQSLRGYAIEEVDDLLDRLADQVEQMATEIADLHGQLRVAQTQVDATRETEATLQRTLVVAQQAAERNLADAAAQAEATLATATADAERLRREAEEEAHRVRSEAEADAAGTLEQAQGLARREAEAARARVERAAARHAEVLAGVAHHRDALRGHLSVLEELALEPPPAPPHDLVAGELPEGDEPQVDDQDGGAPNQDEAAHDQPPTPDQDLPGQDATMPLTVRVHEDRGDRGPDDAPLGSDERDWS
jgi:DivIVA domain-containing protein